MYTVCSCPANKDLVQLLQKGVVWFLTQYSITLLINYTHIVTRRVAVILHAWVAAHLNTVVSPYEVDAPLVDDLILEENKTRKWRDI